MAVNTPPVSKPTKSVVSTANPAPLSNYAQRRQFAEQMSGYNSSSPIWNKQLPEVLDMIELEIRAGTSGKALDLIAELRRRIAKGKLMKAQS